MQNPFPVLPNKSHYFNSLIFRGLSFVLFHHRHRVGRVLSFFSGRRNLDYPNPSPTGECAPHPLVQGRGAHSLAGDGLGESQFRRGDDVYISTLCITDHLKTFPFFGFEVLCEMKMSADLLFPEPERFFGRKGVLYTNYLFPIPNT